MKEERGGKENEGKHCGWCWHASTVAANTSALVPSRSEWNCDDQEGEGGQEDRRRREDRKRKWSCIMFGCRFGEITKRLDKDEEEGT